MGGGYVTNSTLYPFCQSCPGWCLPAGRSGLGAADQAAAGCAAQQLPLRLHGELHERDARRPRSPAMPQAQHGQALAGLPGRNQRDEPAQRTTATGDHAAAGTGHSTAATRGHLTAEARTRGSGHSGQGRNPPQRPAAGGAAPILPVGFHGALQGRAAQRRGRDAMPATQRLAPVTPLSGCLVDAWRRRAGSDVSAHGDRGSGGYTERRADRGDQVHLPARRHASLPRGGARQRTGGHGLPAAQWPEADTGLQDIDHRGR